MAAAWHNRKKPVAKFTCFNNSGTANNVLVCNELQQKMLHHRRAAPPRAKREPVKNLHLCVYAPKPTPTHFLPTQSACQLCSFLIAPTLPSPTLSPDIMHFFHFAARVAVTVRLAGHVYEHDSELGL